MNDSKEFSVVLDSNCTWCVLRRVTRVRVETDWIESKRIESNWNWYYSELIQNSELETTTKRKRVLVAEPVSEDPFVSRRFARSLV